MGSIYRYNCTSCKYKVKVSGGKDRGFEIFTETKVCLNCKEVMDVGTDVVKGMKSATKIKRSLAKSKPRCPECGSVKIKPWEDCTCPKCGGKMKKGARAYFWD